MKKMVCLVLIVVFLLSGCSFSARVPAETILSNQDLSLLEVDINQFAHPRNCFFLKRDGKYYCLSVFPSERLTAEFGMPLYSDDYIRACKDAKVKVGDLSNIEGVDVLDEYAWTCGDCEKIAYGNTPCPTIRNGDSFILRIGGINAKYVNGDPRHSDYTICLTRLVFKGWTFRYGNCGRLNDHFFFNAETNELVHLDSDEYHNSLIVTDSNGKIYKKKELDGTIKHWTGLEQNKTYILAWDGSDGKKCEMPVVADSAFFVTSYEKSFPHGFEFFQPTKISQNNIYAEYEFTDIPAGIYCTSCGSGEGHCFIKIE